jgi:hypothetical protein
MVITAAKRGVKAMGIEYNPDMVARAAERSRGRRQRQGDIRQSGHLRSVFKATVITLFLLPDLNLRLRRSCSTWHRGPAWCGIFRMEA